MLVALGSFEALARICCQKWLTGKQRFRGRIEIERDLSRLPRQPTFSPNTREGRDLMRRIIAAIAALVALVLGGGAGYLGY